MSKQDTQSTMVSKYKDPCSIKELQMVTEKENQTVTYIYIVQWLQMKPFQRRIKQ